MKYLRVGKLYSQIELNCRRKNVGSQQLSYNLSPRASIKGSSMSDSLTCQRFNLSSFGDSYDVIKIFLRTQCLISVTYDLRLDLFTTLAWNLPPHFKSRARGRDGCRSLPYGSVRRSSVSVTPRLPSIVQLHF